MSPATLATLAIPVDGGMGIGEGAAPLTRMYAFPNPTSSDANVWIELPSAKQVRVTLHDALGRELAVLHDGALPVGKSAFNVPLQQQAAGGYVVRAVAAGMTPQYVRLVKLP